MKFTYYYKEWSQDTRSFEIESEVKLTESEIKFHRLDFQKS